MELKGRTALVTGASSGIGESFAYLLAESGSNLILVARTQSKLNQIASTIEEKHNVKVTVYAKDLGQAHSARELYLQIKQDNLSVDLLVNNAGFGKWGRFEEFTLVEYQNMVQLNVTTLTELCHLFLDDLKALPEAGIINVGSTASFIPVPYSSVYAATKGYVLYFTEGLVGELEGTSVKAFCLCPGGTASNFATVANAENRADMSNSTLMSSDEVARIGLDAFQGSRHYIVTGRRTQLKIFKFLSRKRVINLVANYWKNLLGL